MAPGAGNHPLDRHRCRVAHRRDAGGVDGPAGEAYESFEASGGSGPAARSRRDASLNLTAARIEEDHGSIPRRTSSRGDRFRESCRVMSALTRPFPRDFADARVGEGLVLEPWQGAHQSAKNRSSRVGRRRRSAPRRTRRRQGGAHFRAGGNRPPRRKNRRYPDDGPGHRGPSIEGRPTGRRRHQPREPRHQPPPGGLGDEKLREGRHGEQDKADTFLISTIRRPPAGLRERSGEQARTDRKAEAGRHEHRDPRTGRGGRDEGRRPSTNGPGMAQPRPGRQAHPSAPPPRSAPPPGSSRTAAAGCRGRTSKRQRDGTAIPARTRTAARIRRAGPKRRRRRASNR